MPNEQSQPNQAPQPDQQQIKIADNKKAFYLLAGIFVVLAVSGCSKAQESKDIKTSINQKSTNEFTYSDANENYEIENQKFSVLDLFKSSNLAENSIECGTNQDKQYFDDLLSEYTENDLGNKYIFKYNKPSQDNSWTITAIPNKLGYSDIEQFKNDFDLCFAGAEKYPHLISENNLLFVTSCGSGFDDASGLPHGCEEIREIIEPTLIIK